jgi:hypothetical protein
LFLLGCTTYCFYQNRYRYSIDLIMGDYAKAFRTVKMWSTSPLLRLKLNNQSQNQYLLSPLNYLFHCFRYISPNRNTLPNPSTSKLSCKYCKVFNTLNISCCDRLAWYSPITLIYGTMFYSGIFVPSAKLLKSVFLRMSCLNIVIVP